MKSKFSIFSIILMAFGVMQAQLAEEIFQEKYSKLGISAGINKMSTINLGNSAYHLDAPRSGVIGLEYNFHQNGNLNVKTSASMQFFTLQENYYKNQGGFITIDNVYSRFQFPIEAEYYMKLNDKTLFSLLGGLELGFSTGRISGNLKEQVYENNGETVTLTGYTRGKRGGVGTNLGLGYHIMARSMMLTINLKYHYNFGKFWYEDNTDINDNGELSHSLHRVNGNYVNLGVAFNFKKRKSNI